MSFWILIWVSVSFDNSSQIEFNWLCIDISKSCSLCRHVFPCLLCLLKALLYSFKEWYGFYGTADCILWDWLQKKTDYNLFSCRLKKKGRRMLHLRSILYRVKKRINLKRTWYQSYISFFVNCFNFLSRIFRCSKFKTGRTLSRKNCYFNA